MSSVAIMQPYFFPYLGYFQLIAAADTFVLYDDSQYIKNGWSNRNRIAIRGEAHFLTWPVEPGPSTASYRERRYAAGAQAKLLKTIAQAYARAPQHGSAMPLIERLLGFEDLRVAAFNGHAVREIARHIGLDTDLVESSDITRGESGTAQAKVIAICRALGASTYVNPAGGRHLYERQGFADAGLQLRFLEPILRPYEQFGTAFVPGLSIIDLLMFNPADRVGAMARDFALA